MCVCVGAGPVSVLAGEVKNGDFTPVILKPYLVWNCKNALAYCSSSVCVFSPRR